MPNNSTEMTCSICDGTGELCNICGESPNACECSEDELREYAQEYGDGPNDMAAHWGDCEACGDPDAD